MFNIKLRDILESIIDIDIDLFLFLNGIHSATWDIIFYWITSKTFWIPICILLTYLIYLKFKWKVFYIVGFIGLLFFISDQSSVKLFKNVFERLRPCHNPEIADLVHTLNHCGGQFGFVSSHASNSFALAIFSGFLLKSRYKYILHVLLFWAVLVSYSRIYVGVHYPADILCGAMLGGVLGILVFWFMKIINTKFDLKIEDI